MNGISLPGRLWTGLKRGMPRSAKVNAKRLLAQLDRSLTEPLLAALCRRQTARWDREWITYFTTEDPGPFFLRHEELTVTADLAPLSPEEVFQTRLTGQMPPLQIYMPGSKLLGGRVLEVGCGPGLLCKQLGLVAKEVIGIDRSRLALRVARAVSPWWCKYYHTSQRLRIGVQHGRLDCMVCRHFFIHQDYATAGKVLRLARRLLKPGGLVGADFYLPDSGQQQWFVFPCKARLSRRPASCAFLYRPEEIEELARSHGFHIVQTWESLHHQRRCVLLEKK